MAFVLDDNFSNSGLPGWTASNMDSTGGVMKPTAYGTDAVAIWNTISPAAGMRMRLKVGGSSPGSFGFILGKTTSAASLVADHYLVTFTIGDRPAPEWSTPDTITLSKTISTVTTEKTPTNTASKLRTPFVGNTISLRHRRIVAGTYLTAAILKGQVVVFFDDEVVCHELFTGLDAVGYMGVIHYADAAANTTFDDFQTSSLTARYVSKHASASDANDGSDATGNAWATIPKLLATLAEDEFGFIGAGVYGQTVKCYDLGGYGTIRLPPDKANGNNIFAMPDEVAITRSTIPFHAKSETRYLSVYNLGIEQSSATSPNAVVHWHAGGGVTGPLGCSLQGGWVKYGLKNGILLVAGSDHNSGHLVENVLMAGNGHDGDAKSHNIYSSGNNTVRWNIADGQATHPSWGPSGTPLALQTIGYGFHIFYAGSSNVGNNNTKCNYNIAKNHTHTSSGGIIMSHGTGMECIGNLAHNNRDGITVRYSPATGVKCHSNVSVYNAASGIYLDDSSGNLVYHNTVAYNGTFGIYAGANSVNDVAKNNLATNNTVGDIFAHASATGFVESSNWETGAGDPTYNDPVGLDFGLQSASPASLGAIDLFTSDGAVTDLIGFLRPQLATAAFGAREIPNPPQSNPVIVVGLAYGGSVDENIAVPAQGTDPDGDIRRILLYTTGTLTFSVGTPGTATVKGAV